jgi:xanthine dehydrogenase accessory factor
MLAEDRCAVAVTLLGEDGALVHGPAHALDPDALRALATGKAQFNEPAGLFYDPLFPEEKLLILGAGHVGRALAGMAPALGFSVTVVDDRPEYLTPERFPGTVRAVLGDFSRAIAEFPFDAATYAVVVTRGHLLDLQCLRALLAQPYRYAGFMGSARKTRFLIDQVLADGQDPVKVASVCAPIGLDIGAETPEELAIAILGELVAVRRNAAILAELQGAREARRA